MHKGTCHILTGLLSKGKIYAHCAKNVIHTVHEFRTIVNNRNIKQVKNKKKLLGKLYACKLGRILQF